MPFPRGLLAVTIEPTRIALATAPAQTAAGSDASRPAARMTSQPGPYQQFEAFVLQSFIQTMMPKNATEVYGEGTAGEVWKSMLAEKMAAQMAEAGGIGIAKLIAPKGGATADTGVTPAQTAISGRIFDAQMMAATTSGAGAANTETER